MIHRTPSRLRLLLVFLGALVLTAATPTPGHGRDGLAEARTTPAKKTTTTTRSGKASKKTSKSDKKAGRRSHDKGSLKVCTDVPVKGQKGHKGKRTKRSCHRVAIFQGHGIPKTALRTEALDRPSGKLWLYAENLDEEVKVDIYKPDGGLDETVLAQLDELFRCKRTNEIRAMRPEIYEMVSRIQDHFGKRIDLVSGFRFAERNSSRHYHASATDMRVNGVSTRELYAYAQTLDLGGMGIGIYPNESFVHLDFRAPGEPSYRWTDLSGAPSSRHRKSKKTTGRTRPARRPVS